MSLIECVPNVSEGRRRDVVEQLASVIRATPGVTLADYSADAAHNRSVYTFAGEPGPIQTAVLALFESAIGSIDLRSHRGEHPRFGAVDVVPFVPLERATMAECVTVAHRTARLVADRFALPIYLYDEAARTPSRRNLADVRRGGFEGLAARMAAGFAPDFGPPAPHPTAGASAIGARRALIAFNVNLATDRIEVAASVARAVREANGGLPFVKALGFRLPERGIVQVSMNLTNHEVTPLERAFDAVRREAQRYGVAVLESEIVGLAPAAALTQAAASHILLAGDWTRAVLERRLARARG
jgi:glutamate formiminotransferase